MSLEKVVVAVDFSPESDVAVQQALALARQHGAGLTLLHVGMLPDRPVGVPESMQPTLDHYMQIVEDHLQSDRQRLAELRTRISGQGAEISHMVCDGHPAGAIARAAEELKADLVVTGTHGRTGLRRFRLGSVAERVVRTAGCNVLVSRARDADAHGFRRVLVATDFSASADDALDTAVALVAPGTDIDVLYCWYLEPISYPYYAPTTAALEVTTSIRTTLVESSEEQGRRLLERYRDAPVKLSFHLLEAAPAQGIQQWLESRDYDLVVTGSRGRRGVTRWLLGSVAEMTVRHAPCSVLVVHDMPGSAPA